MISLGNSKTFIQQEPRSQFENRFINYGKTYEEHRHDSFVYGDRLVRREEIKVEFIWDILHR